MLDLGVVCGLEEAAEGLDAATTTLTALLEENLDEGLVLDIKEAFTLVCAARRIVEDSCAEIAAKV